MTDQTDDDRPVPVFGPTDLLAGLAMLAWLAAAIVAIVQANDVSGGDQSPIEAIVYMAPWVIVAAGLTSARRMFD